MPVERFRFGRFELDLDAHRLTRDGVPIEIQPKPMALLARLVREPERLHSRQEISEALWPDTAVTEQSLRQVVYKLRELLGPEIVETVPRVGVRLSVPVEAPREKTAALPAEHGAFVGRREELAALEQPAAVRTLVGPGGVGKTRLAVRFARTGARSAWFCALAEARTEADVLGAVALTLGIPRLADLADRIGHALAARGPGLLVLDNAEQVHEAVARHVEGWSRRAPELVFLVTSRRPLGLPEEAVLTVAPLPEVDAVALFRSRARRPDGDVEQIVRLLDGLPLAIELAAASGRDPTPSDLADRMRDGAFAATLDWSWALLSSAERRALSQLAVFAGGFAAEAAEAVLDLEGDADAVLRSLRDQSLVQAVDDQRMDLLGLVREAIAARTLPEDRVRAEARHAAYFGGFGSEAALDALARTGGVARRRAWQADLDNLVAAGRRGSVGAALAVAELTRRAGPLALALEVLETAAPGAPSERERMRVSLAAGRVLLELGRAEAAEPLLETVRAWANAAREPRLEAEALQGLAQYEHDRGRPDRAKTRIRSALALARGGGLEARLRSTAGTIALYQGEAAEACAELERGVAAHRAEGDVLSEARCLLNLAIALGQRGNIAGSGARYQEALDRMHAAGDRVGLCVTLSSLAAWCDKVGRVDEARWYLESALSLARELGDRRAEGIALGGLGRSRAVEDRRPYLEAALAIHRELGWDYGQAFALCGLARLALDEGRLDEAHALADEAVTRAGRYPGPRVMALVERAGVRLAAGDRTGAAADLAEARALGVGGLEGVSLAVGEARLALATGDRAGAEAALTEACRDPSLVAETSDLGLAVAELRAALSR